MFASLRFFVWSLSSLEGGHKSGVPFWRSNGAQANDQTNTCSLNICFLCLLKEFLIAHARMATFSSSVSNRNPIFSLSSLYDHFSLSLAFFSCQFFNNQHLKYSCVPFSASFASSIYKVYKKSRIITFFVPVLTLFNFNFNLQWLVSALCSLHSFLSLTTFLMFIAEKFFKANLKTFSLLHWKTFKFFIFKSKHCYFGCLSNDRILLPF